MFCPNVRLSMIVIFFISGLENVVFFRLMVKFLDTPKLSSAAISSFLISFSLTF